MDESEAPNIKQVIVMRHDLKMRRGKQIAQRAHASMTFLTRRLQSSTSINLNDFLPSAQAWIAGSFAKVCVRCNSEEELMAIRDKANELGLEVHLITDSGRTEFHGQPTCTCVAIGPDDATKIDQVTASWHSKISVCWNCCESEICG